MTTVTWGIVAGLTGVVLLAACGNGDVDALGPESDDLDGLSCSEVEQSLEEPNRVRAETFGGGVEGREAMATITRTIQARPDCFSEEEVAFAAELAETLPSPEQAEAMEAAEEACDGPFGTMSQGASSEVTYDRPEEALASEPGLVLEGDPERSHEGDGWVGFDHLDEDGTYRGWVLVQEDETGWFVGSVVTCGL